MIDSHEFNDLSDHFMDRWVERFKGDVEKHGAGKTITVWLADLMSRELALQTLQLDNEARVETLLIAVKNLSKRVEELEAKQ